MAAKKRSLTRDLCICQIEADAQFIYLSVLGVACMKRKEACI